MTDAEQKAANLGYVQAADGYWYHPDWKNFAGWEKAWPDRPWLDTAEQVLEYEAINTL